MTTDPTWGGIPDQGLAERLQAAGYPVAWRPTDTPPTLTPPRDTHSAEQEGITMTDRPQGFTSDDFPHDHLHITPRPATGEAYESLVARLTTERDTARAENVGLSRLVTALEAHLADLRGLHAPKAIRLPDVDLEAAKANAHAYSVPQRFVTGVDPAEGDVLTHLEREARHWKERALRAEGAEAERAGKALALEARVGDAERVRDQEGEVWERRESPSRGTWWVLVEDEEGRPIQAARRTAAHRLGWVEEAWGPVEPVEDPEVPDKPARPAGD